MELVKTIIDELKLRENGKRGKMSNITDLELLCLAYKLKIINK